MKIDTDKAIKAFVMEISLRFTIGFEDGNAKFNIEGGACEGP